MSKLHTHYDNLKVARDAPFDVIRAAYRTLSQKYHPDKNPGDATAAKIMAVINQSYDVLSDPDRRRQHDDWIRSQEIKKDGERASPSPSESDSDRRPRIQMPEKGSALFGDMTDASKEKLRARVRDQQPDQERIPLNGVRGNYFWSISLFCWFIYLFYQAMQTRWEGGIAQTYMAISVGAAILLTNNLISIHAWYYKPLRPSLIVTPLYVIQTDAERAWFWPLNEVKNFSATHHFRNGSYQYTAVTVLLGGQAKNFSFSPQRAYGDFVGRFSHYLGVLQQVAIRSEQAYISAHDEFKGAHQSVPKSTLKPSGKTMALWAAAAMAALGLSAIAASINEARPAEVRPVYTQTTPQAAISPRYSPTAPSGERVDYIKAKLGGQLPPENAAYISNQQKLNTDGLSTVTIDNSQNDSDVLVKLVYIEGATAYPVRVFFIPEYGNFTVNNVRSGHYEIRYLDRWSGATSKSEPFDLKEVDTGNGIEYSTITMTLYKVANGNMQTFAIDPKDF